MNHIKNRKPKNLRKSGNEKKRGLMDFVFLLEFSFGKASWSTYGTNHD